MQSFTATQRQFAACHEFGHTVGLKHRSSAGCLDTDLTGHHLTAHEVNHINTHY